MSTFCLVCVCPHALGSSMRVRTLWVVGLLCTLVMVTMSARLGHTRSRVDGGHPLSRDSARAGTIQLNFRNVDVLQMITLMSELTGKNFLVDDKVRGKVTLIAPQPVTIEEAYQVFLAALAMQGFTVVPQGPILKIVPSRDAKAQPLPTIIVPLRPHP